MKLEPREEICDAIIIGGGPAGSAAATVLAEHGRHAVVLEREQFPRYKIGESLIPYCWFPLERLGMVEKLDRTRFPKKYSVQFVGRRGNVSSPFYFFQHIQHDCARTWQVVRDEFDEMLLDNAREKGADVRERTAVKELIWEGGSVVGVRAEGPDGEPLRLKAPVTIDASGRGMFAASRFNWKRVDQGLKKIAVWTYYKGARRDPGVDEAATTVAYLPEKAWFWYIPLCDDKVSVGIVGDREYLYRGERNPDAIFHREAEIQPWIRDRLSTGEKLEGCRVTSDYSYRAEHCAADGLVLTGDALAFLDPVFSSGVFLALQGGVMAGDAVDAAIRRGDPSAASFAEYGEQLCEGIEAMRKLVYAFYDKNFRFGDMLRKYPELKGDVTDCLIGNLFRDFEPLFEAVSEFAEVPESLPHGRTAASVV